jgi:REP element-mobilizing transposase RayT
MLSSRRRLRLRDHPYGHGAAYHLTICTARRDAVLATISGGAVSLLPVGEVVQAYMKQLPAWWPGVVVLDSVIMPDHLHLLLVLREGVRVKVPRVVCRFKGMVTRVARQRGLIGGHGLWQRGYHDRVIRTRDDLHRVRQYIRNNPMAWEVRAKSN